jgi:hypothetical protein
MCLFLAVWLIDWAYIRPAVVIDQFQLVPLGGDTGPRRTSPQRKCSVIYIRVQCHLPVMWVSLLHVGQPTIWTRQVMLGFYLSGQIWWEWWGCIQYMPYLASWRHRRYITINAVPRQSFVLHPNGGWWQSAVVRRWPRPMPRWINRLIARWDHNVVFISILYSPTKETVPGQNCYIFSTRWPIYTKFTDNILWHC